MPPLLVFLACTLVVVRGHLTGVRGPVSFRPEWPPRADGDASPAPHPPGHGAASSSSSSSSSSSYKQSAVLYNTGRADPKAPVAPLLVGRANPNQLAPNRQPDPDARQADSPYRGGGTRSRASRGGRRGNPQGRRGPSRQGARQFTDPTYGNCSICAVREINRLHRLENIKKDILRKLRMTAPPNITKEQIRRIAQPLGSMLSDVMYQPGPGGSLTSQMDNYDDDGRARTQQVISFATSPPNAVLERMPGSDRFIRNYFYFPLDQDDVRHSVILDARLSVYVQRVQTPHHRPTQILLYAGSTRHGHFRWQYLAAQEVPLNYEGTDKWYHFNITTNVRQWINAPARNLGLKVMVRDQFGNQLAVIESNPSNDTDYKPPLLRLHISAGGSSRARRMLSLECDVNSREENCCRYPLEVDFVEFGWDWIIAPKRYHAYFCSGECPFVFLPTTPHAHLVQVQQVRGPCCSPSKMSAISMLYFDERYNIIYGTLPAMVVDRCGCA